MNRHLLPCLPFILCAAGCVLPPTQAELLTYQAVAPAHATYVRADPNLDDLAKQRRLDLLEAWRIRVGAPKEVPK